MNPARPVEVRIDRLVLEGVDRRDADRVVAALRERLAERVQSGGVPFQAATRIDRVDAGRLHAGPGAGAAALGRDVADRVHGGMR